MNIAVIGTGYVGLVAGVCFADAGHNVTCVDNVEAKIKKLREGFIPIYEPGLEDVFETAKPRLVFTTDIASAVQKNEVIFVAVGTPEKTDGSADMGPTINVVKSICAHANAEKFLVLKSTVPIGTWQMIQSICDQESKFPIEVINNPEFLKEGAAVDDFLRPDRVVIGCRSARAESLMRELYDPFVKNGKPILFMDNTSAEMTKYAANAFLSIKISFINELARLADKVGADINKVRAGFTSDSRINPAFFYPGVGYGGSCFPKDVKALAHTGELNGVPMRLVKAADFVNDEQKGYLVELVKKHFGQVRGLTLAVWGLAFKPRTDDVREAPALFMIEQLVEMGAKIRAFDPVAMSTAKAALKSEITYCETALQASEGADALLLVTEWNEFRSPDFNLLKKNMKSPVVFDGRNIYDPAKMKALGFQYYGIGRQILVQG